MLGRCGIIKQEEADDIVQGLKGILADIENGTLHIDMEAEDCLLYTSLQVQQ